MERYKTVLDYAAAEGVDVDGLSFAQLSSWALVHAPKNTSFGIKSYNKYKKDGYKIDDKKACSALLQAIFSDKRFICCHVTPEGVTDEEINYDDWQYIQFDVV